MQDHVAGKKHLHVLKALSQGGGHCHVCKATHSNPEKWQDHLQTKEHKTREMQAKGTLLIAPSGRLCP